MTFDEILKLVQNYGKSIEGKGKWPTVIIHEDGSGHFEAKSLETTKQIIGPSFNGVEGLQKCHAKFLPSDPLLIKIKEMEAELQGLQFRCQQFENMLKERK